MEKLNQTFFNQTLSASYAQAFERGNCKASDQLRQSLALYNDLCPAGYESIQQKKPSMVQILADVAKTTVVNYKNWMTTAFQPYVNRWIRAHLDASFHDSDGFTLRSAKYVKSAVTLMYEGSKASTLPSALVAAAYIRLTLHTWRFAVLIHRCHGRKRRDVPESTC